MNKLIYLIALFLSVGIVGCEDNKDIWDNKPFVVKRNVEGIAFKFCLLNEQGQPATIFKKGENITFMFQIINKTGKTIYYNPYECAYANDFFTVIDVTGKTIGKSYEALPTENIGVVAYPFKNKDKYTFKVKWLHSEQKIVKGEDFLYRAIPKKPLREGNYYTFFTHKVKLYKTVNCEEFEIDEQTFKINFKVK